MTVYPLPVSISSVSSLFMVTDLTLYLTHFPASPCRNFNLGIVLSLLEQLPVLHTLHLADCFLDPRLEVELRLPQIVRVSMRGSNDFIFHLNYENLLAIFPSVSNDDYPRSFIIIDCFQLCLECTCGQCEVCLYSALDPLF